MSTRRIVVLVVVSVFLLIALLVTAGVLMLTSSQSAVEAAVPRDAEVGQCYGEVDDGFAEVSCGTPHLFEVYSLIEFFPGEPYPNRFERLTGSQICQEDFEQYTGQNFWTSDLDYSIPFPTEAEWLAGDLITVCVLHDSEMSELTGSQSRFAGVAS